MKKFAKLMVLALVVAAIAAMFAIPSSAATGAVIYVSDAGTGDGSSPSTPIGHGEGYAPANKNVYKKNSLMRAMNEIKETGGTVVVVGTVTIDNNCGDNPGGSVVNQSPNDIYHDTPSTPGELTITSVYGGVDYRTQGAKIVLDHVTSPSSSLRMKNPSVWKDLNIEYKYDPSATNSYNTDGMVFPFAFMAYGNSFVIDTGVKCTSFNAKTNAEGDVYPVIFGGERYRPITGDTNVTVKSGTWTAVYAGGFGHILAGSESSATNAKITGNATLKIEGGKIGAIFGTGSIVKPYATVTGTVDIDVTGGEIGDVYLTNGKAYEGSAMTFDATSEAVITGTIYYAPDNSTTAPANITVNNNAQTGTGTGNQGGNQNQGGASQTGSSVTILAVVAVVALAATSVVISKRRIED